MKITTLVLSAAALLLAPSWAQMASAADAETVTAICKDGTPYSGTTMRGACRGHGGVDKEATAARAAAPAPANAAPARTASQAAPGGGAGRVWVNTDSKVYHCDGDRYYGKTKKGEYMSESAAASNGFHPARDKTCG